MRKVKLVRLVEESPKGAGLVLQIGDQEGFLVADHVAEWIAKLGYTVVTPIQFDLTTEEMEKLGPITFSKDEIVVDLEELATPEGKRAFARALLQHPDLRRLLGAKRLPDGSIAFEPGPENDEDGAIEEYDL